MNSRLLVILVLCTCYKTILSIRCYGGTDRQCMLLPNIDECGSNTKCQCAKYRFPCTTGDQACTEKEQANQVKKWGYTVVSEATCEQLRLVPSVYEDLSCCSTDGCNQHAVEEITLTSSAYSPANRHSYAFLISLFIILLQ